MSKLGSESCVSKSAYVYGGHVCMCIHELFVCVCVCVVSMEPLHLHVPVVFVWQQNIRVWGRYAGRHPDPGHKTLCGLFGRASTCYVP
jgi:hypothetical protein